MSLAIQVGKVEAVLIGNKWYQVEDNSFDLDSYEYIESRGHERGEFETRLGGGQEKETGVPSLGFEFVSGGQYFCGPITSIQAVRVKVE